MILKANCKINLGLDILRKRPDGYHDLETVMLPVRGLYDQLTVERIEGPEPLFCSRGIEVDCPPEANLCLRAFRLMQQHYGIGAVRIELDKRVPFGAGLGGGSSDATTVLLALNELFALHLSEQELILRASELGSDTAFFVHNTPQLCTGRGEVMTSIHLPLDGLWLLLIKPDEGVSTREAYAGVKPAIPATPLKERLQLPPIEWQGLVQNDFETSVFTAHPRLKEIKESLLEQGAIYAAMSGSGSTLFGLFSSRPNYQPPFEGLFLHQEQL